MTFHELLINLLGTYGKWILKVKVNGWNGAIYVQSGKIVKVEVRGETTLSGKDALKFIFSHEKEIESVDLLPIEKPVEKEMNLDQMAVFSLFPQEPEKVESAEKNFPLSDTLEDIIFKEPEEKSKSLEVKRTEEETHSPFLELCKNYFKQRNVKVIYTKRGFEYLNVKEKDTSKLGKTIVEYSETFEEWPTCKTAVLHFEKEFGILIKEDMKYLFVLIDRKEISNFELDEPEIVNRLRKLLRSS